MSGPMRLIDELIAKDPSVRPANPHELQLVFHLAGYKDSWRLYRDPLVVEKVKQLVPISELTAKCSKRMIEIQQQSNQTRSTDDHDKDSGPENLQSREVFFLLLLEWFKEKFFNWFDTARCDKCQRKMSLTSRSGPMPEESKWLASNVEVYQCPSCNRVERFPRYNHPLKLLETRKGRCGEWRNCFTAICVSFNYDMRLVDDLQDHVWNEVYFDSQKRWIHCDCCENAFDTPLLYEAGWHKRLTYCIAVSEYEYQDVTWRYTRNCDTLIERRKPLCRPSWLNKFLLLSVEYLQKDCDEDLRRKLLNRRLAEIVELIWIPGTEKTVKESEKSGRISGSINWRLARGECTTANVEKASHIVKFGSKWNNEGIHKFSYRSVDDEYFEDEKKIQGWLNATFHHENIFKKVEKDWKMTYLCRRENSDCTKEGTLVYKFDAAFDWKILTINVPTKVYGTGKVDIKLTSVPGSFAEILTPNNVNTIKREQLNGEAKELILIIKLTGGEGDIGWQQAQLFRQSLVEDHSTDSLVVLFKK